MELIDGWNVRPANGCKIRVKNPQGLWVNQIPLSKGGTPLEDYFEEWTIEDIQAYENPPTPKRQQYECLCCDKIRDRYTESQEMAIQNNFAMANYKIATKAELTDEDNTAIANMKQFKDCVDTCKHAAHVEIYGEE